MPDKLIQDIKDINFQISMKIRDIQIEVLKAQLKSLQNNNEKNNEMKK